MDATSSGTAIRGATTTSATSFSRVSCITHAKRIRPSIPRLPLRQGFRRGAVELNRITVPCVLISVSPSGSGESRVTGTII